MRAIAEQVCGATPACEQESHRYQVTLRDIARFARQYEVVTSVIRRLTASWCDMVQGHGFCAESLAAVGADRTMLTEQPASGCRIGDATSRMGCELRLLRVRARPTSSRASFGGRFLWGARVRATPLVTSRLAVTVR